MVVYIDIKVGKYEDDMIFKFVIYVFYDVF